MGRPSIYGLVDVDGELRYIGKANDPAARLLTHMRECRRLNRPVHAWLRKNGEPVILILESDCDDWRISEREWIAGARIAQCRLLNIADGGDEPFCSREQRRANAQKSNAAGNKFTSEQARAHAVALNERMKTDPEARHLRQLKMYFGSHASKFGLAPEVWAKLAYCAIRAPSKFKNWYDRLADKHQRFNPVELDRFGRRLDELVETRCA